MMDNIKILSPFGGNGENKPDTIIVHAMGEYILYKGVWRHAIDHLLFMGYSAHFLVTPTGVGIRAKEDNEIAWHAGGNNTNTLGIEFIVPGVFSIYNDLIVAMKTNYLTDNAFAKGLQICQYWKKTHPIKTVTTHHRVTPERKEDPGSGFPSKFFIDLNS